MRRFPSSLFLALVVAVACSSEPLRDPSLGRDGGGAGQAAAGSSGQAGTTAGAAATGAAATGAAGSAAFAGGGGATGSSAGGAGGMATMPTGMAGSFMGTGGMAFMGTGGSMATAMGGTGGLPSSAVDVVLPGPGCGKPLPQGQTPGVAGSPMGYFHYTVQGTGKTLGADQPAKVGPRTFWVRVPPDYDGKRPLRVVYIGQGCGMFNNANNDAMQLFSATFGGTEQAIYVALDIPTDAPNMNCYDYRDGAASQEWEAFELFHTVVDTNYCVDNNRIYVAGYSAGGWLANMWGCYFAGDGMTPAGTPGGPRKFAPRYHIRAQAAVSGGEPPNNPPCNGKVAAIWIHDAGDTGNPISGSIAALTRVGKMNGCDTTYSNPNIQVPWHPEIPLIGDVCKTWKGCPADYPVVFCTSNGLGHADQHERAIPAFKLFFDQIGLPAP